MKRSFKYFPPPIQPPHFCLVPDHPKVGDLWRCECGQYLLAQDNPSSGLIIFSPISSIRGYFLQRKRGKLNK